MTGAPLSGVGPVTTARLPSIGDICAHAHHFARVHEAVFEDRFADVRDAVRLSGQSHELRLHVRGEAGIFLGGDIRGNEFLCGADAQACRSLAANFDAALFELFDHGAQDARDRSQ